MNKQELQQILEFIHFSEGLKTELRHSWLSNGRQESVAEHSWRLSLMVFLMYERLEDRINLEKALKIAIIHDLVEVIAKDLPAFDLAGQSAQTKKENRAIEIIKEKIGGNIGKEIRSLWLEYEKPQCTEAKFVKALDKLECRIQHNESDLKTWNDIEYPRSQFAADKYCQFSEFIKEFNQLVKEESADKIKKSRKDFKKIKSQADRLSN